MERSLAYEKHMENKRNRRTSHLGLTAKSHGVLKSDTVY